MRSRHAVTITITIRRRIESKLNPPHTRFPSLPPTRSDPSLSIQNDDTKHDCRSENDSDGTDAWSTRERLRADDHSHNHNHNHNDNGDQWGCNA